MRRKRDPGVAGNPGMTAGRSQARTVDHAASAARRMSDRPLFRTDDSAGSEALRRHGALRHPAEEHLDEQQQQAEADKAPTLSSQGLHGAGGGNDGHGPR